MYKQNSLCLTIKKSTLRSFTCCYYLRVRTQTLFVVRLLLCSHPDNCCCSSSSFRSLSGFLWLMWKVIWSLFSSCCRICSVLNSTLWLRYSWSREKTAIKKSHYFILNNESGFHLHPELQQLFPCFWNLLTVQVCIKIRMRFSCFTLSPIQLLLCLWIKHYENSSNVSELFFRLTQCSSKAALKQQLLNCDQHMNQSHLV